MNRWKMDTYIEMGILFIYLFIYWSHPVDPMGMGVHKWCQKQELHVLEILEWFDMNKKYFIIAC